ncbi:MAG: hypothetical protein ABJF50_14185 [Paracoccaceae bacterium]
MAENFQKPQSAPQCQLNELGTADTFKTLVNAMKTLSKSDIEDLEDDLSFYAETGLIGVQMSRLLDELREKESAPAAA